MAGFVPIGPVGAVYAMHGRGNAAGMASVLEDMSASLDAAEWGLIFTAMLTAIGLSMTIVFHTLIHVAWRVHWSWYYLRTISALLTVFGIVYIAEPRPSHWLPSLQNLRDATMRCSLTETKLRMRRWWRWRTKYETKTYASQYFRRCCVFEGAW